MAAVCIGATLGGPAQREKDSEREKFGRLGRVDDPPSCGQCRCQRFDEAPHRSNHSHTIVHHGH